MIDRIGWIIAIMLGLFLFINQEKFIGNSSAPKESNGAAVQVDWLNGFLINTTWRGKNNEDLIEYRFAEDGVMTISGEVWRGYPKAKKTKYQARGRWSASDTSVCSSYNTNPETGQRYNIKPGFLWIEASGDGGGHTCCIDISMFNQNKSMSMQPTNNNLTPWWCDGIIVDAVSDGTVK